MAEPTDRIQALREQILSGTVTQTYGNTGYEKHHTGIDIVIGHYPDIGALPADRSDTVLAPVSGRVLARDTGKTDYGRSVLIQSPNGYAVLAGHLADFNTQNNDRGLPLVGGRQLRTGDYVHAGDQIGHEDSTGYSSGKHVHYMVQNASGHDVDPTLGLPPQSSPVSQEVKAKAVKNFYYLISHDLGFGYGDRPGQEPPPPPDPLDHSGPAVIYPFRHADGSYDPYEPIPGSGSGSGSSTWTHTDIQSAFTDGAFVLIGLIFITLGLVSLIRNNPLQNGSSTVKDDIISIGTAIARSAA